MNTRSIITGTGLTLALLIGGSAIVAQAAMPTRTDPEPVAASSAARGTADAALTATLLFGVEEERMARDLYALFAATYDGARPFSMITRSEQQHVSAIEGLLAAFKITDSTAGRAAGSYANPAIQALFDAWKAQGLASIEAAERVGVDLEKRDIADLDAALATNLPSDVRAVLGNLRAASENHLAAFTRAVNSTTGSGLGNGNGDGRGNGNRVGSRNGMGNGPGDGCGPGAGTYGTCPVPG